MKEHYPLLFGFKTLIMDTLKYKKNFPHGKGDYILKVVKGHIPYYYETVQKLLVLL